MSFFYCLLRVLNIFMAKLITVHWPCFLYVKALEIDNRQSSAQDRAFIGFVLSHLATTDVSAFFPNTNLIQCARAVI